MEFSVKIDANAKTIWKILWEDIYFREWAGLIDEGSYMKGILKQGNEIQFMSSSGGYGVTSFIEKLVPEEYIQFRHSADTKDFGENEREKEWTGGRESYAVSEKNGKSLLTVSVDIPGGLEELMNIRFPLALKKIKELSEKENDNNS